MNRGFFGVTCIVFLITLRSFCITFTKEIWFTELQKGNFSADIMTLFSQNLKQGCWSEETNGRYTPSCLSHKYIKVFSPIQLICRDRYNLHFHVFHFPIFVDILSAVSA